MQSKKFADRVSAQTLLWMLLGGVVGFFATTAFFSWGIILDLVCLRFYGIQLPMMHIVHNAGQNEILRRAEILESQGCSLAIQKAALEHGVNGIFFGAALTLLVLLTADKLAKAVVQAERSKHIESESDAVKLVNWIRLKHAFLFKPLDTDLEPKQIWNWWEERRTTYNVIVLLTTVISFTSQLLLWGTSGLLEASQDIIEPILVLFLAIMLPVGWNICYTAGPVCQVLIWKRAKEMKRKAGPALMHLGIWVSICVVVSPTLNGLLAWSYQASRGFPERKALKTSIKRTGEQSSDSRANEEKPQ